MLLLQSSFIYVILISSTGALSLYRPLHRRANSPGLGVELETSRITLKPTNREACSRQDIEKLKGNVIGKRTGAKWELTADTTITERLDAEYILDGTKIKLRDGTAGSTAQEIATDLEQWNPAAGSQVIDIANSPPNCVWNIENPRSPGATASMDWQMQVTAAVPLEAIADIFRQAALGKASPLIPFQRVTKGKFQYVMREFFQSSPNGITTKDVQEDVLGFFSLVMSYAKLAEAQRRPELSIKSDVFIMPRSDFVTLYRQIKNNIKGSLYDIAKVLSCFKPYADDDDLDIDLDGRFCTGSPDKPKYNGAFDKLTFGIQQPPSGFKQFTIKEWLDDVQSEKQDLLTIYDKLWDGSIGAFGNSVENVLDSQRQAPLFEFRNLDSIKGPDVRKKVEQAEQEVIDYHIKDSSCGR